MGSKTFEGVRFSAYLEDHPPPHIHASYAEAKVILDLIPDRRAVRVSERIDAVKPANAKRSSINHIRRVAAANFDTLARLWQEAHP